jgi:molecular chaperone GrpE
MSETKRIPVRVMRPDETAKPEGNGHGLPANGREAGTHRLPPHDRAVGAGEQATPDTRERVAPAAERPEGIDDTTPAAQGEAVDWQDRAQRLQAEMENYRRRQQRLAQDQIESERERLLRALLEVVDDLERALASSSQDGGGFREGVQLTHRAALQRLKKENVERIEARGRRFDPAWHEAVSTVPGRQVGAAPETVVQVLEPGYRRGDRLLRPARVVVAV